MRRKGHDYGQLIRSFRKENGLSQTQVADTLGVSQGLIAQWEGGQAPPEKRCRQINQMLGRYKGKPGHDREDNDSGLLETGRGRMGLASWLEQALAKKDWSVYDLAKASSLTAPTIYLILNGTNKNPRQRTLQNLERALEERPPRFVGKEMEAHAKIEGIGTLADFDPYSPDDLPEEAGVYVLYDISKRPVYVGESDAIGERIRQHKRNDGWFKPLIIESGAYLPIKNNKVFRKQVEDLLIAFLKDNAVLNQKGVHRQK